MPYLITLNKKDEVITFPTLSNAGIFAAASIEDFSSQL
jgi:hypothetical protein